MIIEPAATSQSIDVQIVDDSGLAVTGLVASTFPAVKWSLAGSNASVAITLSDLALITTAWTSGGLKERSGGFYRLDIPNAALATAGTVTLIGDASGKHLLAEPIVVATAATLASIGASALTSLILSLEIRVGGVLTDADATPTMADRTNAFGIRRADTLAVIVAAGKPFTHDGTGLYSYTLDGSDADHPQALAGVTYEYWPHFTIAGTPLNYQQTKTASTSAASGTYADDSDLSDWYGQTNIDIYSNLDNVTTTRDEARVQKFLTKADDKINLSFRRVGRTAPIPSTEADFSALSDVAAEWAGAMLAMSRGGMPENAGFGSQDEFEKVMGWHIKHAMDELESLVLLWSENQSDTPGTASAAGAITAVVGPPKQYPGTGSVRPAAYTLPSLTGNVSW